MFAHVSRGWIRVHQPPDLFRGFLHLSRGCLRYTFRYARTPERPRLVLLRTRQTAIQRRNSIQRRCFVDLRPNSRTGSKTGSSNTARTFTLSTPSTERLDRRIPDATTLRAEVAVCNELATTMILLSTGSSRLTTHTSSSTSYIQQITIEMVLAGKILFNRCTNEFVCTTFPASPVAVATIMTKMLNWSPKSVKNVEKNWSGNYV